MFTDVAKIDRSFIFHSHPDSYKPFYVISSKVKIEIEGKDSVETGLGRLYVVPKGVSHRPVAWNT